MQKLCPKINGQEPQIEIKFGKKMYSLRGCNNSLHFKLQGRQLLSRRKLNLLFLEASLIFDYDCGNFPKTTIKNNY